MPRADRNHLLTAAGLAPAYVERELSADQMQPVRDAVDWMLTWHDPFPAFAMDRHWRVQKMNQTAQVLLAGMGMQPGDSMLMTLAENEAVRAAIGNLDEVLMHTILRVRTEIAHLGGDAVLEDAVAKLSDLAGDAVILRDGVQPAFIPTIYKAGRMTRSMLSTFTQFGTVEDIALSELRIEMLFPADDATRQILESLGR